MNKLITKTDQNSLKIEYKLKLSQIATPFALLNQTIKKQVHNFLSTLTLDNNFDCWHILGSLLAESLKIDLVPEDVCARYFENIEIQEFLESSDLDSICQMYQTLNQENKAFLEPILRKHIVRYWQSAIQEHVEDMVDTSDIFSYQDNSWITDQIDSIIDDSLSEYPIELSSSEITEIYDSVDPQKVIDKVHRSFEREDYQGEYFGKVITSDDEVDDLFKMDLPNADNE